MPDVSWYRARAIKALTKMGIPDADPAQLTDWASTWRQKVVTDCEYPVDGVLITDTGRVVGEAINSGGTYRLTSETMEKCGATHSTVDLGKATIAREVGAPVRLVKSWEVAPRRPLPPKVLCEIEDLRNEIDDLQILLESKVIEAFNTREETGITVNQLTKAMGAKTRKAVYNLVGRADDGAK